MASIKAEIYVTAWINDSGTWDGEFSWSQYAPSGENRVLVAKVELDVPVPEGWDHREPAIANLEKMIVQTRADAEMQITGFRATIGKLLAIENKPSELDETYGNTGDEIF